MAHETRHEEILNILTRRRRISVQELTERFGVSEVTIRKDLTILEEQGYVIRTHGGARLAQDQTHLRTIQARRQEHTEEKRRIAAAARQLISEGDTVLIDAGTTCAALAREIRDMNVRVVTNSINVMVELADSHNISLHSVGGSYRMDGGCFIGPAAEAAMDHYRIDICFIGTPAFTADGIFSSQNMIEANFKRKALSVSRRRVVLADRSKFEKETFAVFGRADDIDILVTDCPDERILQLRELGIELVCATEE
jgi:DeoR/GlpR family transcriptional regulator of sugar metabolism